MYILDIYLECMYFTVLPFSFHDIMQLTYVHVCTVLFFSFSFHDMIMLLTYVHVYTELVFPFVFMT